MVHRRILTTEDTENLAREAADTLRAGGVVLYPTDTLYGLGADAFSNDAVDKVYAIKGRDPGKPMHAIVESLESVAPYAEISEQAEKLARAFWPGPLTLILKKKQGIETGIARDLQTIGVRLPKNEFCIALAKMFGGFVTTTSANLSGATPVFSVEEILAQLGDKTAHIDLVIDAGVLPESKPSTIVDLSGDEPKILREGAIPKEEIFRVL